MDASLPPSTLSAFQMLKSAPYQTAFARSEMSEENIAAPHSAQFRLRGRPMTRSLHNPVLQPMYRRHASLKSKSAGHPHWILPSMNPAAGCHPTAPCQVSRTAALFSALMAQRSAPRLPAQDRASRLIIHTYHAVRAAPLHVNIVWQLPAKIGSVRLSTLHETEVYGSPRGRSYRASAV